MLIISLLAQATGTQQIRDGAISAGSAAGFGQPQPPQIIVGSILGYAMGFLGTIFLVLIIYGGFLWMTAGGNEQQIEKAKKILTQSTIGLLIVVLAYAIGRFIIDILIVSTT